MNYTKLDLPKVPDNLILPMYEVLKLENIFGGKSKNYTIHECQPELKEYLQKLFPEYTKFRYQTLTKDIPIHVWVDETRPRNQGANLTSFELNEEGIDNTIIADNTGGLLMQRGEVDLCIVGTDRTLSNGDVCNKIGTYLKALAAYDNNIPFYVALPSSTIDWNIKDHKQIPIEERNPEELSHLEGFDELGDIKKIQIYPKKSKSLNLAFDVTPSKYVTKLITEKGICDASLEGLNNLFK